MYIYIIKSDAAYKIGKADSVKRRLANLQTAHHVELELIASLRADNAFELESKIHYDLQEFRVRGEWFVMEERVLRLVIKMYGFTINTQPKKQSKRQDNISKNASRQTNYEIGLDEVIDKLSSVKMEDNLDRATRITIMKSLGYTEGSLKGLKIRKSKSLDSAMAEFIKIGYMLYFKENGNYPYLQKIKK